MSIIKISMTLHNIGHKDYTKELSEGITNNGIFISQQFCDLMTAAYVYYANLNITNHERIIRRITKNLYKIKKFKNIPIRELIEIVESAVEWGQFMSSSDFQDEMIYLY